METQALRNLEESKFEKLQTLVQATLRNSRVRRTLCELSDESRPPNTQKKKLLEYDETFQEGLGLDNYDVGSLEINTMAFKRYQNSRFGEYNLQLFEAYIEAIHSIAAELFQPTRKDNEEAKQLGKSPLEIEPNLHHPSYRQRKLPKKNGDIAAFWAEDKIYGGVFWFDRGESGNECLRVFMHPNDASNLLYEVSARNIFTFLASLEDDKIIDVEEPLLRSLQGAVSISLPDIQKKSLERWSVPILNPGVQEDSVWVI